MKGWKEKTFGILIACGQCDSCRGAVLCALCYCRHQGQLHLLLCAGKTSSHLWAARRDQLELTSLKVLWCYQTGRVSNNLVISLSLWFPNFLNLQIAGYLKNDTETRQLPSLSVTHLLMNKPRSVSVCWDFTEKLHKVGHHFPGCCCVWGETGGQWQMLTVIPHRNNSRSVSSLWCSGSASGPEAFLSLGYFCGCCYRQLCRALMYSHLNFSLGPYFVMQHWCNVSLLPPCQAQICYFSKPAVKAVMWIGKFCPQ